MLKSLYTTATGMKAQQTMVDMIANNIANVNTAGFKKSQASFEDLFYVTLQSPGLARGAGDAAVPIGTQIGSGTRLNGTTKVFTTGTLEITERTLDVAIDGEGFFALNLPDGSLGYTRDGGFHTNATGKLVTGSPDTSTLLGQVTLHRFINPSGMLAVGANVLRPTEASGPPITNTPGTTGLGLLKQGFIERSNVQIVNELVNLIVAQRAYEVNSRAIQTSDQMLSTATNLSR
jgi:flagellar basal-body rod protein FlgG